MSTTNKMTGSEFDSMVARGAFDSYAPSKIELIHGELRIMNPAGPVHDDYIEFLNRWSHNNTSVAEARIRVQSGFVCNDDRPEPDVLWLKPQRYGKCRPTAADVMLLIEVSDSSLMCDLTEKADLYAASGVQEYWVIDIPASQIHVMTNSNGSCYCDVEVIKRPNSVAPICKPTAILQLAELFEIMS